MPADGVAGTKAVVPHKPTTPSTGAKRYPAQTTVAAPKLLTPVKRQQRNGFASSLPSPSAWRNRSQGPSTDRYVAPRPSPSKQKARLSNDTGKKTSSRDVASAGMEETGQTGKVRSPTVSEEPLLPRLGVAAGAIRYPASSNSLTTARRRQAEQSEPFFHSVGLAASVSPSVLSASEGERPSPPTTTHSTQSAARDRDVGTLPAKTSNRTISPNNNNNNSNNDNHSASATTATAAAEVVPITAEESSRPHTKSSGLLRRRGSKAANPGKTSPRVLQSQSPSKSPHGAASITTPNRPPPLDGLTTLPLPMILMSAENLSSCATGGQQSPQLSRDPSHTKLDWHAVLHHHHHHHTSSATSNSGTPANPAAVSGALRSSKESTEAGGKGCPAHDQRQPPLSTDGGRSLRESNASTRSAATGEAADADDVSLSKSPPPPLSATTTVVGTSPNAAGARNSISPSPLPSTNLTTASPPPPPPASDVLGRGPSSPNTSHTLQSSNGWPESTRDDDEGEGHKQSVPPGTHRQQARGNLGSHHRSDSAAASGVQPYAPRALRNFGATCYMNATLQCLMHSPHLISCLTQDVKRVASEAGTVSAVGTASDHASGGDRTASTPNARERQQSFLDMRAPAAHSLLQLARGPATIATGQLLLSIKGSAASYNDEFSGNGQNDAHEFLRTILYVIHDEVNKGEGRSARYEELKDVERETEQEAMARWMKRLKSVDDSTVYDCFGGVLRSRCECLTCGSTSMTFDPFLDLSLPVSSGGNGGGGAAAAAPTSSGHGSNNNSLSSPTSATTVGAAGSGGGGGSNPSAVPQAADLILRESFCEDTLESLTGKNQFLCERCKGLRDGTRCAKVLRWPRNLVLHLNRFDDRGRKNRAKVIYPQTFMVDNAARYRLFAVCCHSGSENRGHYTSYVNVAMPGGIVEDPVTAGAATTTASAGAASAPESPSASVKEDVAAGSGSYARRFRDQIPRWFLCNDNHISEVDAKEAVSALETAYILFYCQQ